VDGIPHDTTLALSTSIAIKVTSAWECGLQNWVTTELTFQYVISSLKFNTFFEVPSSHYT